MLVSQPIEEVVNTVQGLEELRSVSGAGNSIVIAVFSLDRDIEAATQDVRDRIATVLARLPRDVRPPVVGKADNDSSPVITIAVSANRPLRELTEIADKLVKPFLERSGGVGEVEIVGGLERAISVWVDADRLAAYQLPITAVRDALAQQNADLPGGNVTGATREQTLRTMGRVVDPRAFGDLVIATQATACPSGCATSAGRKTARRSSGRSHGSTACRRSPSPSAGRPAPTRSPSSRASSATSSG